MQKSPFRWITAPQTPETATRVTLATLRHQGVERQRSRLRKEYDKEIFFFFQRTFLEFLVHFAQLISLDSSDPKFIGARSVIIHEKADDGSTTSYGKKVACGTIVMI